MSIAFVLAGLLVAGGASALPQGAQESAETRPLLPGERGHILKMTREMVELAKNHDSERRMDLFLAQARERLREREALEKVPASEDRQGLARELGKSYAHLLSTGAAGSIECGAAEGRDMSAAASRYVEAARGHHERWMRLLAQAPGGEQAHDEGALEASGKASERAREAREAGLAFFAQERARQEARTPERAPETPRPPAPPTPPEKKPILPPEPPPKPAVAEPIRPKPEPERPDKDPEQPPRAAEHHPPHPHRPHR
jgi:hypothetical protein